MSKSSIHNIRKFHNWIKGQLFSESVKYLGDNNIYEKSLLELAVGKGGDMHKWNNNGIKRVVGFDISDESINGKDGAKDRYNNFKHKFKDTNYEYHVIDLSDSKNLPVIKNIINNNMFTIGSCQFALHYFFKTKKTLETFLTIVSTYLVKGGIFIGTTLDGSLIKNGNNSIYDIKVLKESKKSKYNNTYQVQLGDRGEDHYFSENASIEYMVDLDELKSMCDKYDLQYIGYINFKIWYEEYKQTKSYQPLTLDEQEYSFINFSFCFIKK